MNLMFNVTVYGGLNMMHVQCCTVSSSVLCQQEQIVRYTVKYSALGQANRCNIFPLFRRKTHLFSNIEFAI